MKRKKRTNRRIKKIKEETSFKEKILIAIGTFLMSIVLIIMLPKFLIKEPLRKTWIIWLILIFCCYFITKSAINTYRLSSYSETRYISGIVIDEVYSKTRYSIGKIRKPYYLYAFWLNGKKYTGPTGSLDYYVGDSVKIKYSVINPEYNELVGRP